MSKKVLTLAQKHGYANIILGAGFLLLALIELTGNVPAKLLGSIANLLCSLFVFITLWMKSEMDDERSIQNLEKAGQHTLLLILIILAVSNCVFSFFETLIVDPKIIIRTFIGIGSVLYGYFFLYYEKEGY